MKSDSEYWHTIWAVRFLRWFCPEHLLEEIEGDLFQKFNRDAKRLSERRARQRLAWNAIRFFRPEIILRNRISIRFSRLDMLSGYFKVAYRHLMKGKSFGLIHVSGLAIGITAFLVILQYISFELSFDNVHKNRNEIYRIAYAQFEHDALKSSSAKTFGGIRDLVIENIPEVTACTAFDRTAPQAYFLFDYAGKKYFEQESFYQMDSNFFKVFPSFLSKGDAATVLKDPHNLVLSQKMVKKLFGEADPIGKKLGNKSISYSSVSEFVITGVLADVPENAHFHPNFIALNSLEDEANVSNDWGGPRVYTYLTLKCGADPVEISDRINALVQGAKRSDSKTLDARVFLQPLRDIHLRSSLHDELEINGNERLVYILSLIGIIVLVLAWINYVNMETARFTRRIKEVSVRRIIGSGKGDLALQFIVEYFCITMLAGLIAIGLFHWTTYYLTYLTGAPINSIQWATPTVWMAGIVLFSTGTVIAGIYPAFFLLRINPIATIKGKFTSTKRGASTRKSLIVVQFTTAITLVAFLAVITEQLDFMRSTDKKMNLESIISIRNPSVYANDDDSINYADFNAFKNRLLENHAIANVTSSSVIPGVEIDEYFTNRIKRNLDDADDPTRYRILFVDYNFIPFYGMKLSAGRNYSAEMGDEENWNNIILNEKAMRDLGFNSAKEAVNQEINFHLWGEDFEKYRIIGIVENYHQETIKKEVEPIVLSLNHGRFQQVFYSVKLHANVNPHEGLANIEKTWKEIFPDKPFEYFFQDDYYDQQFKSELYFERAFAVFSSIAIFIACLGILGLTLFEANSRLKEISLHKLFGATMSNLIALLSKDYLKLLAGSSILCVPIFYYAASTWLEVYPTHIQLSPMLLVLPILFVSCLVVVVASLQTAKAVNSNPVDSLKGE